MKSYIRYRPVYVWSKELHAKSRRVAIDIVQLGDRITNHSQIIDSLNYHKAKKFMPFNANTIPASSQRYIATSQRVYTPAGVYLGFVIIESYLPGIDLKDYTIL